MPPHVNNRRYPAVRYAGKEMLPRHRWQRRQRACALPELVLAVRHCVCRFLTVVLRREAVILIAVKHFAGKGRKAVLVL